jgi:hypothetical protein
MLSKWVTPTAALHRGGPCPFKLQCSLDLSPATHSDLVRVGEELGVDLPAELLQFWRKHKLASLFKDVDYGQWGLDILSPSEACIESKSFRQERRTEATQADLIIGRFLGDSDLLLIQCIPDTQEYGSVLVVRPLDTRAEWPFVAKNFTEFLDKYEREQGDKFWEVVRET